MGINVSKISTPNLIYECHAQLNKIGEITYENVKNADAKTRQFLSEKSPARLKELAQMNCFAADKIKTELDNKYGANNYIVIAIGRSISSIAELLKTIGVNTLNIPLSGLRKREIQNIPKEHLKIYRAYLEQIGLTKKELKNNSDKTYILMDYSHYGHSLERAERLLKKDRLLGDAKNLISVSINKILGEDYERRKFETLFCCSRFKDYSMVGRLPVNKLNEVYNACSPQNVKEYQGNITSGLRKLFWFNTFDSLVQKNYQNIMPRKEFNAMCAHYYNAEAARNRMNIGIYKIK